MVRTLSIVILLVLSWYVESQGVASSSSRRPLQASSFQRNPPVRNPYGYGRYRLEKKCTHPSVSYRVFRNESARSAFWQIPKKLRARSQIVVGRKRKGNSVWVMEYINVTSSDPKYLIRTRGSPPLYITYHSSGEVSLQQQVSENSYFAFEIGELGGYSYRVPGSNKTLGVLNRKLHLKNDRVLWYTDILNQNIICPNGHLDDHLEIRHRSGNMWYYDSFIQEVLVDIPGGPGPLEARWISRMHSNYMGRDFRNRLNTAMYVTSMTATSPLQFQASIAQVNAKKRIFESSNMGNGMYKIIAVSFMKYVRVEAQMHGPDVLGLTSQEYADDWAITHLGWCCGLKCFPYNLYPQCVWQFTVATAE